tara:strand:+ start:856 stop:1701 length:846 start_codon:yes stop_codon:yes gene_type:complete
LNNLLTAPNAIGDIILASEIIKEANSREWLIYMNKDFSGWTNEFIFNRQSNNIVSGIASDLNYGIILDFCGQDDTIEQLRSAKSIKKKIGFYNNPFYDQIIKIPDLALRSSVFETYAMVQEKVFCTRPYLSFPEQTIKLPEKTYDLLIYPFSGNKEKNWNIDNFKKIYNYFKSKNKTVKFLNPLPCGETIIGVESDDVIETKDWIESTEQISRSKLLLANDSSIAHIGAYVGVFTISIFLKFNWEMWFPYPPHKGTTISKVNNKISQKQLEKLIKKKLAEI